MAITTYTELQTAVGNWLGRSDLTSRIPEFIALAEPKIRRNLRDRVVRTQGTLTAGNDTLSPAASFKQVVSLALNESSYMYPLRPVAPNQLALLKTSGSGRPTAYAVVGGVIHFDIVPAAAYAYVLVYVDGLTALSGGNPTNNVLSNSPDIYMYGALLEAAPYLEHDQRVPLWSQAFEKAISEENIYRERADNPNAIESDLPVVFGGEDGT